MKINKELEIFMVGVLIGDIIGMLFAPKSGKKLRKNLTNYLVGIDNKIDDSIKEIENELSSLKKMNFNDGVKNKKNN